MAPHFGVACPETAGACRPRSAVSAWTGLIGLAASIGAVWLLSPLFLPDWQKALLVVGATALPMLLIDLVVLRVDRNPSAGLAGRGGRLSWERLLRKLVGLSLCLGGVALAYWLFPEYAGDFYAPVWAALAWLAPALVPATLIYILYVDSRQSDPEDSYAQLGRLALTGAPPDSRDGLWTLARTWAVKGFFMPLMFVYLTKDVGTMSALIRAGREDDFLVWYDFLYQAMFLFDLIFAVVGYACTLRLVDAQVRSADPTMFGWAVCLVCYQPFWSLISAQYLRYDDAIVWGPVLARWPLAQIGWGCLILFCVAVYVWATVCFGLRFSNLTYRGTLTHGPYRFTKHPAYVSKNLSWWLISVPFLAAGPWTDALRNCLLLAMLNGVYALRALTEERHLASRDADYVAYRAWMRDHGLFAPLRRRLIGR